MFCHPLLSQGFGFIDFASDVDAAAANELDGMSILGSRIRLDTNANTGKQQPQQSKGSGDQVGAATAQSPGNKKIKF